MKKTPLAILLSFLLAGSLLAGCISITVRMPGATEETASLPTGTPVINLVPTPEPTTTPFNDLYTVVPTPEPTYPTPTPDYTLTPPAFRPTRSLYFLAKNGIWVVRPNAMRAERLTSEDVIITAFDVWQDGPILAFATKSGKLYTQAPGKDALLFLQLRDTPYPAYVNGIDWSPDGSRLAYTVVYDNGGEQIYADFPSRPSGVWIAPLGEGEPTFLLSNHYPQSETADASGYRTFADPEWSPDGQALLVRGNYWERSDIHWIFPLQPAEDDRNLHVWKHPDPAAGNPDVTWGHASWTPDSQAIIFSSQLQTLFSDLAYATRDGSVMEVWQAGSLANLYIAGAHMVPEASYLPGQTDGITAGPGRLVYLGKCPVCANPAEDRIHTVKSKLIDLHMNGSILGTYGLCPTHYIQSRATRLFDIEWSPDFSQGIAYCDAGTILTIDLYEPELLGRTLSPLLPKLAENEPIIFRWGEITR